MRSSLTSLGLLFRLSALTLGATFGSLLLGIWLDRMMGTAPFGTLCLMTGGIFVGTLGIYRSVRQANQVIANQDRRSDNGGRE